MIRVDTSFWIALRNRRAGRHHDAAALLRRYAERVLVTSNQIRDETWTYLRRCAGHAAAVAFLDALESSPRLQIIPVEDSHENTGLRCLRQDDQREYSFVDATSFSLMRAHRLSEAFALDGDFTAAGFVELRPDRPRRLA